MSFFLPIKLFGVSRTTIRPPDTALHVCFSLWLTGFHNSIGSEEERLESVG